MMKMVCRLSIIDAPWTPSPLVSPVSSLHHHPDQFLQLASLRKFLSTPLLMEAAFAVAPRHGRHHIPHPEASLGNSSTQGTHKANTPISPACKGASRGKGGKGGGLEGR